MLKITASHSIHLAWNKYSFLPIVVCHCVREGEFIRIISDRKADKTERKVYEGAKNA